jgi:prepilin-type N-terminal cleavage/methylation domain-containing protein
MDRIIKRGRTSKKLSFTLIEVMGAIVVLSIGVLVAYTAVQRMMVQTNSAANRLGAAYLAEEGIEIVRNIRDTAWIDPAIDDWTANGINAGNWQISSGGYSLSACPGSCGYSDMGFVSYMAGTNNKFKRRIIITRPTADSIKVTADILWQEQGSAKTLTAQSYLYNWK